MNFDDLKNIITFAREMNFMKKPFTFVYKEWCDFWEEYFRDLEADYWIEEYKNNPYEQGRSYNNNS